MSSDTCRTPVMRSNIVDLPAPLGPINPTTKPRRISNVTLSTATSPPKRRTTLSTRNKAEVSGVVMRGPVSPGERGCASPHIAVDQPGETIGQEHQEDDDENSENSVSRSPNCTKVCGRTITPRRRRSCRIVSQGRPRPRSSEWSPAHELAHARIDAQADDREGDPGRPANTAASTKIRNL